MFGILFISATSFLIGCVVRELGLIQELYNVVETITETNHSALVETAKIVTNYTLTTISQLFNKTVLYNNDGTCTLQFVISNKLYTFNVYPEIGPACMRQTPAERGESSLTRYALLKDKWLTKTKREVNEKDSSCHDGKE